MSRGDFWWRVRKINSLFLCLCALAYFHLGDNPFLRIGSMDAGLVRSFYSSLWAVSLSILLFLSLVIHMVTTFFFRRCAEKPPAEKRVLKSPVNSDRRRP
jgi:hypothetical protein